MRVLRLTTDLELEYLDLKEPIHETMHEAIGGYLEIVRPQAIPLPKGMIMIVDEEGLLKRREQNLLASVLYGGFIAGDVLFVCERGDRFTSIPQDSNIKEIFAKWIKAVKEVKF